MSAVTITGDHIPPDARRIVDYAIGKYNVKVILSANNEFLGIAEVAVNTDFRLYEQKSAHIGVHQIEEFYREEG